VKDKLQFSGEGANDSLREPKANQALAGLNIVITRPREQAVELAQRIQRLGGNALLFPLLEIAPASDACALLELAEQLAAYDLLIFISPNAVRYGMAALDALPSDLRVAAVGQTSTQALHDLGIASVIAPSERFDSEALLAMPELQSVSGWRVAILRGDGGRELLGDTLKARGAQVEYITCYQRSKPNTDVDALLTTRLDAISVTSSEALAFLWQILEEPGRARLAATPLFVPHARIKELARQQGWLDVTQAASGDDGMIAALIAWAHAKRN
jgi:uroporphyrinogen-III synthase